MVGDALVGILGFVLYILLMGVVAVAVLLGLVGAIGTAGAVLSTPLLYVFPDVRRFLALVTGDESGKQSSPIDIMRRRRFGRLCLTFGLGYGLTALLVYAPLKELELVEGTIGPVPLLAVAPVLYVSLVVGYSYRRHRRSNAWRPAADGRVVFLQWLVFVGVAVLVGILPPLLAVTL